MHIRITHTVHLTAALVAAVIFTAQPVIAQSLTQSSASGGAKTKANLVEIPALSKPLTRRAIRDILSGLSDSQAREMLLRELDRKVAAREAELAERDNRALGVVMRNLGASLMQSISATFQAAPRIPEAGRNTFASFKAARGGATLWRVPGVLILCLLGGIAAAFFVRWFTRNQKLRLAGLHPANPWSRMGIISARFLLQGAQLIAFVVAAHALDAIVNRGVAADSSFVRYVIRSVGWTWFAVMLARFALSPSRPSLRLCAVDDQTARFLTRRIGMIFGWSAFSLGMLFWLQEFGWIIGDVRLGFWFAAIFYGLIVLTIWQARNGVTQMIISHGRDDSVWRLFAEIWPKIAIVLVILQWFVVQLFVATGNIQNLSMSAINMTLAAILALPLFEPMVRGLVEAIWPDDPEQEPALRAAHVQTQEGLIRCARIITALLVTIVLAKMWGLNLSNIASQGVGAQLAGAMVEIFVIVVLAYGLWELINIVADRQIAIESVKLGVDPEADEQFEGEGGEGGTRLGTLMPLLRGTGKVAIVVLAALAILGQLGVNVTPLLAGAGIIGLAIGFGAQTLVKDIISGVFFLVDDAFRKGEYIDLGTVKGTVEKISIRSMQLRHHNGPLNTIPFGEIAYLTNFSRDWVMMKLPLRVTYDTDLEKMRKLIKKLGQDLMEDPELGPKFLQPLKSQGVIQMEDSAMIVRVKFMTRPGDQWPIRNKVFARIRDLFEKEGIKFAHREVTVRIADHDAGVPLSENERKAATAAARSVVEQADGKAVDR